MNRLLMLVVSTALAFFLTACSDNAEKKVEEKATTEMNQSEPTDKTVSPANPDQSKLDDANKEINNDLSSAAISSANQQVAQANNEVINVASNSASESLPV